jgi:hypothetical protein
MSDREIILPSGKFASIREIKWLDYVMAETLIQAYPHLHMGTILLVYCVKIDGEPVTYDQLTGMDIRDVLPLIGSIYTSLTSPVEAPTTLPEVK